MTQPDGAFPDSAANFESFAEFAAKTQEDWEAGFRNAEVNRWGILAPLSDTFIIGDLIEILSGVEDGDLDDVGSFVNRILRFFTRVPIGAVTEAYPELLSAPTFEAGTMARNNTLWDIDPNFSRTNDGTGAAKIVITDGTPQALRSGKNVGDYIAVGAGQIFSATVHVAHQSASGTVRLQVVPYTGGQPGEPVTMTTETTLPGDNTEVPSVYTVQNPNLNWPGYELTGRYVVPAGVDGIQLRILVEGTGAFWFDDASARQVGKLRREHVDGLPDILQEVVDRIQLVIDGIFNALTGGSTILNTIEDLVEALLNIPHGNVQGVGGPKSIGEAILGFINAIIGGLVGAPPQGDASPADAFNIAKIISERASRGDFAWEVVNYRNNTSIDNGLLPSSEASINLSVINTSLEATQDASLIGIIRVQRSAPLGVVSWLGHGVDNLTAFYVNIWRIDPDDGDWELVYHSDNILGDLELGSTPAWNFHFLPPGQQLPRVAGEVYACELVPVGTGTHYVRGVSSADDIPDHPYVPYLIAATRDNSSSPDSPPSTIPAANIVRSKDIPYLEFAIDVEGDPSYHDPVERYLSQSTTIPIPNWCNRIDLVCVGGGGGGAQGAIGLFGNPGQPGKFNAMTLVRGEDFDSGDVVEFTRGGGGSAGQLGAGGNGGSSTLKVNDITVTAAGGDGGAGFRVLSAGVGYGPGNFEYNGRLFVGGGNQAVTGAAGVAPGGAGNGGTGWGIQAGGAGAPGGAWVVFRQEPVEDEQVDIVPPTPPTTLTLLAATHSSLTVLADGGEDPEE